MTEMESILKSMNGKDAEHYKQWYAMMRSSYEFGLSAQKVLINAGVLKPSERLFLTRQERRQLTHEV
jgi:hypothetical protein